MNSGTAVTPGVHHAGLTVPELAAAYSLLKSRPEVTVEFAPEPLAGGPTRHLMGTIPGAIRLEFSAPAGN